MDPHVSGIWGGGGQSQTGCWAWRGGSRAEVRLRAGLEGALSPLTR